MSLGRARFELHSEYKDWVGNEHQVCPSSSFSFNLLSALPWPPTPPFFQEQQKQQTLNYQTSMKWTQSYLDLGTVQSAGSGPLFQSPAARSLYLPSLVLFGISFTMQQTMRWQPGWAPNIASVWPLIPLTAGPKEKSEAQCLAKAKPLSQGAVDTRFLQLSYKAHSLMWLAGKVKILSCISN